MKLKIPLVTTNLKTRLWSVTIVSTAYLVYTAIGTLIPGYWDKIGLDDAIRSILSLGFVIILLITLSGFAVIDKLESMAVKDGLTGLFNQTFIKDRVKEEVSRTRRYHDVLSLLMIDIDFFKRLNDKYGHTVGDRVLKDFAEIIRKNVRISDIPGRYGGEEFLVVLPQTPSYDAAQVADRIREQVTVYRFKTGSSKEPSGRFTICIGVSTFPADGRSANELIVFADMALLEAKRSGKNKIVIYNKNNPAGQEPQNAG